MPKEIIIKVGGVKHQKWQRMLLVMQNSPHVSFRIQFDNREESREAYYRLRRAIFAKPSWFTLLLFLRDTEIYIVKQDKAQRVAVLDD